MSNIQTNHLYRVDLDHCPCAIKLEKPLTHQDAHADVFTVALRQGMKPIDLSGTTVKGYLTFISTHQTLPLEGKANGSTASLPLTAACYAQPGPFSLILQITSDDVRHTVLHVSGCIARSADKTIVDPDDVVPSLADLLMEIDHMRSATDSANAAADSANEACLALDSRMDEFRSDIYTAIDGRWAVGGLHTSHGTHYSNTARCRTKYLNAHQIGYVKTAEGFAAAVYAYDSEMTYLGMSDWAAYIPMSSVFEAYPATAHIRVNFKAEDEREMSVELAGENALIAMILATAAAKAAEQNKAMLSKFLTEVTFVPNGLESSDGDENTHPSRVRTDFVPVDEFAYALFDGNYKCAFFLYDEARGYIGYQPWVRGLLLPETIRAAFPTAAFVRFLISAEPNRNLFADEVNADPGVLVMRSDIHADIAARMDAVSADAAASNAALDAKIEANAASAATSDAALDAKIEANAASAAASDAALDAKIEANAASAAASDTALDAKIEANAADATSTLQILLGMIAATAAQVGAAAKSDGVTTSLGMYDRIGICGASWDSGYIYTSQTKTIERERLSWPKILAMRCGNESCNYSVHGVGTFDWLTHDKCGVKMLADEPCDLYVCTLGGNDMRKRGLSYIGTIEDITAHSSPDEYGDTFYGNYGRIIQSIRTHAPNARILLIFWYWPELHDPENAGRKEYFEAMRGVAEHYGLPYLNWADDAWYNTVSDNQLGAHPTAVQVSGISYAFERLYSSAVSRFYKYFCHYPEPAPAFIPMSSNLSSSTWVAGVGNGYSSDAAGREMLARLNTNVTGLFALTGQGSPLREIDTDTWELTGNASAYYPISVPTYAKKLCLEGPAGCELRVFTSVIKSGQWMCHTMYDWGSPVQTIDLSRDVVDGVSVNLRSSGSQTVNTSAVKIWFE